MMEVWVSSLVIVVAALLSGAGAWWAASAANRKVPSETAHILTETALSLVEPLRERITELEVRVEVLEVEVVLERRERLWRELHAAALAEQLHAAGLEPVTLHEIRRLYPNP